MKTRTARVELNDSPKPASEPTKLANSDMAKLLDFANKDDIADATRDRKAYLEHVKILSDDGLNRTVWTLEPYEWQTFEAETPLTVNPSLWRQSTLNTTNGLYLVCERVYQVRAFDMSNMTIIEGDTGLILIDPLISCECARDALELYKSHVNRPDAKVKAVIFTHSHIDHFGGVLGVVTPEEITSGSVEIVAPEGFLEHAVSENVYAGVAMSRRAQYMYGPYLKPGPTGQVDGGLGKGQSVGRVSIARPTVTISHTGARRRLDGVLVEFHMTPGAEAPAEFDFYFPELGAFCASENATHTMHNIQTLRGARVRDALLWSKYMNETLNWIGHEAKVLFASHHWPVWDEANGKTGNVARFLTNQRDMYRYLNDQTLRMLNKGYTGIEIAEVFEMPPALAREWSCRGYYGSVNHNVKAVYDRYMGWFDGNPSNLHPLPPHQSSPRYVALMGGPDAVLDAAMTAAGAGEYRWAAELLNKLIFTDPQNRDARLLQADVLEQLGYQAEAATWRNFYLMGAQELRGSVPDPQMSTADPTMVSAMTTEMVFDALAAQLNGHLAGQSAEPIEMQWIFTSGSPDVPPENVFVEISNGAMSTTAGKTSATADPIVTLARSTLDGIICQTLSVADALERGLITIEGDASKLLSLFAWLDPGVADFPIVTPRPDARAAWTGGAEPGFTRSMQRAEMIAHRTIREKRRLLGQIPRGC